MKLPRVFIGLLALGVCGAPAHSAGTAEAGIISISGAWYGFYDRGDVTSRVKQQCDGKAACDIPISNDFFGTDPDPGTKKEFYVKWTCGGSSEGKRGHQAEGTTIQLSCP